MITVFVPVYNREKYISDTINSVLNQSYKDFELLIINDGSTDSTSNIITQFSDPRIRQLHNPSNLGLAETRNRGLLEAKGEYIALLDSDDLMAENRLKKQIQFLEQKPDIAGVGSRCKFIDESGNIFSRGKKYPINPDEVKISLLFYCSVMNGTFMGRTDILRQYAYDSTFKVCEDYDLFSRITRNYKLSNLPDKLVNVRKHTQRISHNNKSIGEQFRSAIMSRLLSELEVSATKEDLTFHRILQAPKGPSLLEAEFYEWAEQWLITLIKKNECLKIYNHQVLKEYIKKIWHKVIYKSIKSRGIKPSLNLITSNIRKYY